MSGTEVRFNLQGYLEDLRRELQDAHRELSTKVDGIVLAQSNQDSRLKDVEQSQERLRWLGRTAIGAAIAALASRFIKLG